MLMLSGLIFCSLTGLAVSLSGYETGNFINIFEYIGGSSGSVYYTPPPYMTYHHGSPPRGPPPFHKPPSPHYHGSAPPYHYGPPPQHRHGLPPPFRKPPHYHHHPHHPHYPHKHEPVFGSSFEQSGSWESQENDGNVYQYTPPTFGSAESSVGCNFAPVSQVVSTTTISASHPVSSQQTSNVNTLINGVFPGLVQEGPAVVSSTASGTTISRPGGSLISGGAGQQTSFQNTFEANGNEHSNNDNQVSPGNHGSDVDLHISGVPQHLQPPHTQNSQSFSNTNVENLISNVFPSTGQQSQNTQITTANSQSFSNTNVDNLISNVFPSTGQQSQNTQITTSSQTNVNNLIAGVFPSIGQQGQNAQQNTITSSVSTSSNTLVSGVIQSLPPQQNNGVGFQKPFSSSFKPGGLQTNGNAIPVFQPDYPSQKQPETPTGSDASTTSQNIPTFQPGIGTTSTPVTTGANGNGVSSTDDEAPAYDIDIRFGGDDSSRRRRNESVRVKKIQH